MKRLVVALILGFAFLSTGAQVFAGGDDSIYPLDYPVAFPWDTIEGTWAVDDKTMTSWFTFQIQRDCDNIKTLKVTQIDPETSRVLAQGIGYLKADSKQVYAAMKPTRGSSSYLIFVGAFKDMRRFPYQTNVILRMAPFGDWKNEKDYLIRKVNTLLPKQKYRSSTEPLNCEV
jgi:hypothetical protein